METISILLSGGLDSFIGYHYGKKSGYLMLPISVDLGHPYAEKERQALANLHIEDEIKYIDAKVVRSDIGKQPTIDSWVIPARNLLLATIGAMYSSRVWLSALSTEFNRVAKNADKSYEFFLMASGILTFICGMVTDEDGNLRKETIVESPFKEMSKREIIYWALNNDIKMEEIKKTSSCFAPEKKEGSNGCGKCPACFNRKVAMVLNGIQEVTDQDPFRGTRSHLYQKAMISALDAKDFTHYAHQRIYEVFKAMRMDNGNNMLSNCEKALVSEFINANESYYESKLRNIPALRHK